LFVLENHYFYSSMDSAGRSSEKTSAEALLGYRYLMPLYPIFIHATRGFSGKGAPADMGAVIDLEQFIFLLACGVT